MDGRVGCDLIIYRKDVYLTFCLWLFETSQLSKPSPKQSNSRCLRDMYISFNALSERVLNLYAYRRGLLRCSFRRWWAMRRPQTAGRVTGTDSRAFLLYTIIYVHFGNRGRDWIFEMEKVLNLITWCVLFSLFSCSKENDELEINEDEYVTVPICLSGEYTETDVPLREDDNKQEVYAVQIYEMNENTSQYTAYAYGIFDNPNKIIAKLKRNKRYQFYIAIYYNYFEQYAFKLNYDSDLITNPTNSFIQSEYILAPLHGGISAPFVEKESSQKVKVIETESFYGNLTDYSPESNQSCSIYLYKTSIGLEVTVEGLTSGTITTENSASDFIFSIQAPNSQFKGIFTHADAIDLKEYIKIFMRVYYIDNNGEKTEIISDYFDFYRNHCKRIKIKLNSSAQEDIESSIFITKEENEMIEDEELHYDCQI